MVRAKMKVIEIAHRDYGYGSPQKVVKLTAVSDESNKTWAKYTPGGSIEMTIDNPEALNQFSVGQFFFVDFSPAPAKEADEVEVTA